MHGLSLMNHQLISLSRCGMNDWLHEVTTCVESRQTWHGCQLFVSIICDARQSLSFAVPKIEIGMGDGGAMSDTSEELRSKDDEAIHDKVFSVKGDVERLQ